MVAPHLLLLSAMVRPEKGALYWGPGVESHSTAAAMDDGWRIGTVSTVRVDIG
jgi:hypothetical protein